MATAAQVRDLAALLVRNTVPSVLSADRFRPFLHEAGVSFIDWCESSPAAAFRRYALRSVGQMAEPEITNLDESWCEELFTLIVAYPHTHRYGARGAVDRDDAILADQVALANAIGPRGAAAFAGVATHLTDPQLSIAAGESVDFLVISQQFGFYTLGG